MARVAITESYLEDIADAIREKTGLSEETYTPSEMAPAIATISGSGGITPTGTINITENGTYNVTHYANANVSVPNSYGSSDEGKVVSNGALVSQSGTTYTENGTYDTTLKNSVTVNVAGSNNSSGITIVDTIDPVAGGTIRTITEVDDVINKIALNTFPSGDIILSNNTTKINRYAFAGKSNITSIIGPEVTTVAPYAFVNCGNLSNASFPKLTRIDDDGFHDCTGLVTLDVRNLNSLVHRNFQNCTKLTTFVGGLTKLPSVGQDVFNGCSSLSILVLPALTGNSATRCFRAMTSLATIDLGLGFTGFTGNYNFQNSTSLTSIILRNPNQVVTISSTNEITGTPFANGGTGGTLYVPNSLISSYQSASNWSVILGYTNNQIKSIESTHTDSNAFMDLTLYYADGTEIPIS